MLALELLEELNRHLFGAPQMLWHSDPKVFQADKARREKEHAERLAAIRARYAQ